ncbi:MAG: hypothetical protein IKB82_07800 [Clostridia bacterium]|nr:hypothetical protein [Clostridia bacterium]
MNAAAAFEHRKDWLISQIEQAQNMQQAVLACTMALEQTACELAQDEADEQARQRQQAVMAVARRAPAVLQAATARGELIVSQEENAPADGLDRMGRVLQIAGVLALTGLAVFEYVQGRSGVALLQAVGALLFVAGSMRVQPDKAEEPRAKARGVAMLDAKAAASQMQQLCEAVDICMQDLALVEAGGSRMRLSGTADDAMLDLLVALMEAKASGRDEMAMRSLSLAEEYLHMLGVDVVFYTEESAALFDALPTMGQARTVRPALVKEGKPVRRGVAAVQGAAFGRGVGV